jgi:cardiolipin synthase
MTWTHGLAIASLVLTVVTITLQVLLSLHVLRSNKEPIAILFWIQLLVFLPGVGVIAYAMFGMELKKRRLERRRRSRRRVGPTPSQREDVGAAQVWNLVTNLHQAGPWPTQVERIHTSGAALIEDMEQTIDGARRSIWLETYILRQDEVGRRILERLKARAAQGLDVRVLYDAVGSYQLSRRFVRELARAGVRIACFSPKNPLKGRFQIQYRNHRKITVVDQETAFVGGFNIGDEYLGKGAPRGVWRDTHLRVRGQVVTALAAVFAEDWHFGTGEALPLPGGAADGVLLGSPAALLVSGAEWQVRAIHSVLLDRMFKAQDTVDLATAYFVPDPAVRFAMVDASRRGVQVRLLRAGLSAQAGGAAGGTVVLR